MDYMSARVKGPRSNRRILHWVVAAAFFVLFITGLIVFVPALSGLAAGGWTRMVHRVAAVILIGAPAVYALTNTRAARLWLKEALFWDRKTLVTASNRNTWKKTHKLLIAIGFVLFAATGMIQWLLKGILPSQAFQWSLSVHDIIFFGAALVLAYHFYYELDWWLWKRRYCRHCSLVYCVDACPTRALTRGPDGSIEYYPQRCNNCRLCMEYCRRNLYHKKVAELKAEESPGILRCEAAMAPPDSYSPR